MTKKLTVAEENAANPEQNQIRALLVERRGLEQRGLKDRVKQVDAALDQLGYKPPRSERRSRSQIGEQLAREQLDQSSNPQVETGAGSTDDPEEAARLAEIEEQAAEDRKAAAEQRKADAEAKGTSRAAKPRSRRGRATSTG